MEHEAEHDPDDDDEVHVIGGNEAKNKCGERKHGGSKSCTEESEEVSEYEDTAKEKAESRKSRRKSMNDKKGVGKKKIRLDEIALTQKRHLGAENKETYGNIMEESTEKTCLLCEEGAGQLGHLLEISGRYWHDKEETRFFHEKCLDWTPDALIDKATQEYTFDSIKKSYWRARALKCSYCQKKGAGIGCFSIHCRHTFHLKCAQELGCTFVQSTYAMYCPEKWPNHKSAKRKKTDPTPNGDNGT